VQRRSHGSGEPIGRGLSQDGFPGLRVLVVDDEPIVREVISGYLERDGFDVVEAGDGEAALRLLESDHPSLVILDVMLPEVDGLSVLAEARMRSDVPVILLTARSEEPDRVRGLELGADDYISKPFSPRELSARVRAVLKRSVHQPVDSGARLEFDGLVIDEGSRQVILDGRVVDLTPKEFDLLLFLASFPRRVFSRAQLLEQVWDSSTDWQDPSTVTVHVRRVRQKIEETPEMPRWVSTVWGVGYRFQP
jgi:DNA-binding response OmpR family regulator